MVRIPSRVLFPTDEPLAPERMIGRGQDVDELAAQLRGGVHRILAAPRRTGKSTVARAAVARVADEGAYAVSLSLFELTTAAALAERMAQRALANRGPLARVVDRARAGGGAVLRGAALTLSVKAKTELGDGVEVALTPGFAARDPHAALLEALRLLQAIAERDERPLILFIDELQEIAGGDYGDGERILKQMREILAASSRVTCLFAGSVEHLMRDLFSNRRRALYGFGGFYDLSPISEAEWHAGLAGRFQADEITADDDALERIIESGRAHPRCTMLIAQQAHVAIVEQGSHKLDLAAAERGYRGALLAERARHADGLLDVRRLGPAAVRVLTNLAHAAPTYRALEPKSARRALDALATAGLVSRGPRRGEWSITDPLFADYLVDVLPRPYRA
jgi:hypothetical protein